MTPDQIKAVLEKYEINMEDATWSVHGKIVIYHSVLERIATKADITFDPPQIVRAEKDEAVMIVTGRMGAKVEWATGEALLNANYKIKGAQSPYVYAMSEKRGKDRVVLKLLSLHGDVYSEDEADDLKQQFDAEAASRGLIQEIDACKNHDEIESLMKTRRVTDDLAKMSQQMQTHIKGYAKDAYRYMRSRSQVHRQEQPTRQGNGFGRNEPRRDEWETSRQIRDEARNRYEERKTEQRPTQQTQQRLPENASDRRDQGPPAKREGFGSGNKSPDEILAELSEQFEFCHTVEEVNATTEDFKDAIGRLTPPDIEEANRMRKSRIAAIDASERARS